MIFHGDCLEILPGINGVSAVVTDPPYELGFMGKSWDSQGISFRKETWEIIRASCLPGAMLLCFGGTRTFHRIACAIEDAGWELRDTIGWMYGSGFPKSLDISKAIDKSKGSYVKGEILPSSRATGASASGIATTFREKTASNPQTPEALLWSGYGTALKPAWEPIIVAMNPLDGTFANNALKHGVAGLNVDGCRVGTEERFNQPAVAKAGTFNCSPGSGKSYLGRATTGRFPANLIHDGSQEVMDLFPETGKSSGGGMKDLKNGNLFQGETNPNITDHCGFGDSGSTARFFYCAKASRRERDEGLENMPSFARQTMGSGIGGQPDQNRANNKNNHPTVKPLALITYLVKLVTMPEYNLILDPFMGSGTTLLACKNLGLKAIGIEQDQHSAEIAEKRCNEVLELVGV